MGQVKTNGTNFASLSPLELPAPGNYLYDVDQADGTMKVIDHNGALKPVGEAILKHTVTYADFVGSAQQETISLGLVPPGSILKAIYYSYKTDFVTAGISAMAFQVKVVDETETVQYFQAYNGSVNIGSFNATLAGPCAGATTNDISGVQGVFNRQDEPTLKLVAGVDMQVSGGSMVSIGITGRWGYTFEATSGATLDGAYFLFSDQATEYYVWYNTGSSIDPTPAGNSGAPTGIQVDITLASTAAQVARATQLALYNFFGASLNLFQSGAKFRITDVTSGAAAFLGDVGTSGFTIVSLTEGGLATKVMSDLTAGEIEIVTVWSIVGQ